MRFFFLKIAMARPIWNGTISFGLLNVPVQLYSGARTVDLLMRKIIDAEVARLSGKKVKAAKAEEVEMPEATTNVTDSWSY